MESMYFPLALVIWACLHSLLASLRIKEVAYRYLGEWAVYYRLFYVCFAAASLAAVWWLVPKDNYLVYQVGSPVAHGFWLIRLVGIALFITASVHFDAAAFMGMKGGAQDKLNTGGLFAYVRHPLYLAGLMVIWSQTTVTIWWLEFAIIATAYLFIGARLEERKLAAIFGEPYRDYQRKVPMWLPAVAGRGSP